jgi:K+-transporting ATPase ATPase A chain
MGLPGERAGMLNSGAHGRSEVLYAFTSAADNNGSAFAGITVNTTWYNTALGLVMLFGRLLSMLFVLGMAGSFACLQPVPVTAGTRHDRPPPHRPVARRAARRGHAYPLANLAVAQLPPSPPTP